MSLQLTVLGSSGALPAYGRYPSSQLLTIDNRLYLIDCGEGVQMQLAKVGASLHKINHIFISHLHGDHYLGLPGLLFSMHLNKRENDLHIYSFRGLDEILLAQFKHSKSTLNYRLVFHVLTPRSRDVIYEDEQITVETIPLMHKLDCAGFLFREKPKPRRIDKDKLLQGMLLQHIALLKTGKDVLNDQGELLYRNEDFTLPPRPSRSYAYCSDTAYFPELCQTINEVDLLYHEATFMESEQDKAVETMHSTAMDAARIAAGASVKRLLIGHFSARYKELDALMSEARSIFPNTKLAEECITFNLEEWN